MRISFNKLGFKIGTVTGAFLASIFGAGLTTLVFAAIPHSATGVIDACFDNTSGALRVIDKQSSASCGAGETAINWNQKQSLINTENADLTTSKMPYWDLRGVNFTDAKLDWSDLRGTDFRAGSLAGASITNANLSRAKLSGLDLSTTGFTGSTIDYADFSNVNLSGNNFYTIGANVNFSGANFTDLRFYGQYPNADFSNVNMTNALLSADFTGANFSGVTLTNATWEPSTICPDATNAGDNGDTCVGHL